MSTLPFQVEELIATFNSTNIGTEALELAKLQAQLQQALQAYPQGAPFPTSPVQPTYSHGIGVPTNTPTARTHIDASHGGRRRRSSSTASGASARQRGRQLIREEDEDYYWRQGEASARCCEMDQDVMEDVEEEAQVDASLYSTTSPIQFSQPTASPTFGSSPTTYALTDPFLLHQLQAAERSRQPSFFAQLATAQQSTSPFYGAAHQQQSQQTQSAMSVDLQPPHSSTSMFQPPSHPARHPLTIDTGPRCIPVNGARIS